jgi:hypothetical protein
METETFKYEIFCGAECTMKDIAKRGATGLNTKTHKWQIIDKTAKYEVRKSNSSSLYFLFSDKDLHAIAEEKGLLR